LLFGYTQQYILAHTKEIHTPAPQTHHLTPDKIQTFAIHALRKGNPGRKFFFKGLQQCEKDSTPLREAMLGQL
jgi:hypothetical protein